MRLPTDTRCDRCGQVVGAIPPIDEAGPNIGPEGRALVLDGINDDPSSLRSRPVASRRVWTWMGAAIAVWLAFFGVGQLVGGDDSSDRALDRSDFAAEADEGEAGETKASESTGRAGQIPATQPEPNDDEAGLSGTTEALSLPVTWPVRGAAVGQADRIARQLERRGQQAVVVYRTATGVAAINLTDGVISELSLDGDQSGLLDAADAALFRVGPETLIISKRADRAYTARDDGSLIVQDGLYPGVWSVEATLLGGQAAQVQWSDGAGAVATFASPHGHQLETIGEVGLIARGKGPNGGSQIANQTGFEQLGAGRLVAVTPKWILEEVCDEDATRCSFVVSPIVVPADGSGDSDETVDTGSIAAAGQVPAGSWALPTGFVGQGDALVLSPDGLSVLRVERTGLAEVYSSVDDSVSWVIGRGMESPVWGADSSHLLWIDRLGAAEIKVMFLDERDWVVANLTEMGAPTPTSADLLILPTASPASTSSSG